MRPEACEGELLRRLAGMPFLDRLEMVAVTGRSRGAVYEAVRRMEETGLVASVSHAAPHIPHTRRYCLTAEGLHRLARDEGMTVGDLLEHYPVSEQRRRLLMERLDAVAVIYRLASAISNIAYPIHFRWYRAMPMDATMALPDGKTVARRQAGSHRRPDSLLQKDVAAQGVVQAQRRANAHARPGASEARSQTCGRTPLHGLPGPGEGSGRLRTQRLHLALLLQGLRPLTCAPRWSTRGRGVHGPRRSRPSGPTSPKSFLRTVRGGILQATCCPPR